MSEKKSITDYVKEYILNTHQNNPDYFSNVSSKQRNADFKLFCEQNKKLGLDFNSHRGLLYQQLAKLSKEIGLDSKIKKQQQQEKYKVTKGIQEANVTVEIPQQQTQQQTQQPTQPTQQTTQQQTQQTILHPSLCQCFDCKSKRGEVADITEEEAGEIMAIPIDFWHARNPNVQPMTEHEIMMVGKRLKPILQRHLGGDWLLYGLALLACGRVISSRLEQAKKGAKDKIEKQRDEANERTSKEDDEDLETQRKFFSKEKLKKIRELGESEDD